MHKMTHSSLARMADFWGQARGGRKARLAAGRATLGPAGISRRHRLALGARAAARDPEDRCKGGRPRSDQEAFEDAASVGGALWRRQSRSRRRSHSEGREIKQADPRVFTRPYSAVSRSPCRGFVGDPKVVGALKVEPELRLHAEPVSKLQRSVARDSALTGDDLADPVWRHIDLPREFGRRNAQFFRLAFQHIARMNGSGT